MMCIYNIWNRKCYYSGISHGCWTGVSWYVYIKLHRVHSRWDQNNSALHLRISYRIALFLGWLRFSNECLPNSFCLLKLNIAHFSRKNRFALTSVEREKQQSISYWNGASVAVLLFSRNESATVGFLLNKREEQFWPHREFEMNRRSANELSANQKREIELKPTLSSWIHWNKYPSTPKR